MLNKIRNRKIWCAASTHPTEEIICAKSHIEIKKKYNNILTIIIPRHIDRVEKIKTDLLNLGLKAITYSKPGELDENTDILIIDSYGESLKFYNVSKSVFLGKSLIESLANDSGQNPIEPARMGCKIFHGPNVSNFVEIYNYLKELGVTKKVNSFKDLSLLLVEEFSKNTPKNDEITAKIEKYGVRQALIQMKKLYVPNLI